MTERFRSLRRLLEILVAVMIFLLANRRAWYCFLVADRKNYYCIYGSSLTDFIWWALLAFAVMLLLIEKGMMSEYLAKWKRNGLLLVFMAYAVLSLVWSIDFGRSVHMLYVLIATSITAAALATIYPPEQILRGLLWLIGAAAVASLIAVILVPDGAITQVRYLAGTWRGVFAHKNFLGTMMGFGNGLFLFYVWQAITQRKLPLVSAAFYLLTLFLVIMSRSGTGLITLLLLNGLTLLYFVWRRWKAFLRTRHYVWLGVLFSVLSGVVLLNLGRLLALIGKQPSLTGRLPLWQYLVREVVSKHPWFGYGLETLWYDRAFQAAVGIAANWGILVINAHSAYMAVLIYLGIVGLVLFLLLLLQIFIRVLRYVWIKTETSGLLPLLFYAYVITASITIDYFLEFESFHWMLVVMALFIATPSQPRGSLTKNQQP